MSDDPEKIALALKELEQERERRIGDKLQNGTAVRGSVGRVIGVADNKHAAPARDEKGREIFYEVDTIITGVPRSGRDTPGLPMQASNAQSAEDDLKPDYTSHLKKTYAKPPPPRPKPPAEAVKPPEPGPIQTQVRAPSQDGKDPGEVISGWYDIQNGQVVVWERSGGAPIGRQSRGRSEGYRETSAERKKKRLVEQFLRADQLPHSLEQGCVERPHSLRAALCARLGSSRRISSLQSVAINLRATRSIF